MNNQVQNLEELSRTLGIPVDQLKAPSFPTFRNQKGYKLRVVAAKNLKSKKGTDQVELSVVAVDENGEPNTRARAKIWLSYPFDNETYRYPDADSREKAIRNLGGVVRATGEKKYSAFGRVVQDGMKKVYFDHDGNELSGDAIGTAMQVARLNVLAEAKARMANADAWVGTEFYAQYDVSTGKDGKTYKNWQKFSAEPLAEVNYVLTAKDMLSRNDGSNSADTTEENLF